MKFKLPRTKQCAKCPWKVSTNRWLGGNEPKAEGFRTFFVRHSEFDYIDSSIDIEDISMDILENYPFGNKVKCAL